MVNKELKIVMCNFKMVAKQNLFKKLVVSCVIMAIKCILGYNFV